VAKIALSKSQLATLRQVARLTEDPTTEVKLSEVEALCDLELAEPVDGPERYRLTLWGKTALKDHGKE
jgi:hypothetical protein